MNMIGDASDGLNLTVQRLRLREHHPLGNFLNVVSYQGKFVPSFPYEVDVHSDEIVRQVAL